MIIKQSVAVSLPCILVDDSDFKSVETGVVFGDVTVKYCKEGGSEVTKTILVGDWHEIGGGEYLIDFTNDELNTVGKFTYRVTASGILAYFGLVQIEEHRVGETSTHTAEQAKANVTNLDAAVSTRSTITEAQVKTQAASALTDYDPPTRGEATTDKEAIITEVDANEAKIDTLLTRISSAVATALTKLAGAAIVGTETAGSLFRLFYDRVTGAVALNSTVAKENTVNVYANYKADLGPTNTAIAANLTAIQSIQNNTNIVFIVPLRLSPPDVGSVTYRYWICLYDNAGNPEAPDSAPTIRIDNVAGVNRVTETSFNQDGAKVGVYYFDDTITHDEELEVRIAEAKVIEGGVTRYYKRVMEVTIEEVYVAEIKSDTDSILTKVNTEMDKKSSVVVSDIQASISALNNISAADVWSHADATTVKNNLTTLLTRLSEARAGNLDNLDKAISALNDLALSEILSDATPFKGADINTIKGYVDKIDDATNGLTAIKTAINTMANGKDLEDITDLLENATYGLSALKTAIGLAVTAGPGSTECTVTIYETGTTDPVPDADAWVSTDEAGGNVVAGTLQTNSSGQVKFMLDLGVTYYIWAQKDGVNITNPTEFTPS